MLCRSFSEKKTKTGETETKEKSGVTLSPKREGKINNHEHISEN
jgi:hypothetical protein